jgi:transposase
MKDQATREKYIELRASGKSYRSIAKELDIAKSTCQEWEKELASLIADARKEREQELIDSYSMSREARIERLAGTLESINAQLAERGLQDVSTEKLLKLKLDYERELKSEYLEPATEPPEQSIEGILEAYAQLYTDSKAGKLTPAQTKSHIAILESTLKAINQSESNSLFSLQAGEEL